MIDPVASLVEGLDAEGEALVRRAYALAARAHAPQLRNHGAPYIGHPLAVAAFLRERFGVSDPQLLAAALLHDVAEDAPAERVHLLEFPDRVQELVRRVTNPRAGMTSNERRVHYESSIWPDADAAMIKTADRVCNLNDSLNADPDFRRHYVARTRNEMLSAPGLARYPVYRKLIVEAVEACERSLAASLQPTGEHQL